MLKNANLENLEIKLQNARVENAEKFEKIEKNYQKNYKEFVDSFFKTDVLGAKKTISALFQLEAFNRVDKVGGEKNTLGNKYSWGIDVFGKEILEKSLENGLKILPINGKKREILKNKILKLESSKNNFGEVFREKTEFSKDKNFPILESLYERKILDNSDMLSVFTNYEKTKDIRFSLEGISNPKKEIIKKYFYELNDTKKEDRIKSFKQENAKEIKKLEEKYPKNIIDGVVKFVGRNFFKMKPYKKRFESKKLRLRRTFKIALLKLLRIKYKGFNIKELIKKIDSIQDFESMFILLMKLIDIIPENNELLEKFSLKEEVDEVEEIITEAELNKEKILLGEKTTINISKFLDEIDGELDKDTLEKLLSDDVDFVGGEVKIREKNKNILKKGNGFNGNNLLDGGSINNINAGILKEKEEENKENEEIENDEEENFEKLTREDLEIIYNEIKLEFSSLEKEKLNLLLNEEYEELDEIISKLIKIQIKLEKIEKLLK